MLKQLLVAAVLLICLFCVSAHAVVFRYDLEIFTDNGMFNDDPAADFYFLLSDEGGLPKFEFHNDSLFESSITDVYFDGDVLAGIFSITQSAGVDYSEWASPSDLPSGNTLIPGFTADFSAESNPPPSFNGINNSLGEWLALTMNMSENITFNDVHEALSNAELRVGVHLQAFSDDSSESAINDPEGTIPEPSVISIFGLACLGLFWKRRKK